MSTYEQTLTDVATRTLEELCFFFADPQVSDEQRDAAVDATMSVAFVGPLRGRLVVRLCGGMLRELASNMLGDADGDASMQRDALAEVTNVMCGNVVPLIGGSNAEFVLAAPQQIVVLDHVKPDPVASVHLGLDQAGRVDVMLYLDAA
ncbi:MAG: chemotaxis protein CheX [bacterium]